LEKLADALGNLLYVVFGTAVECGIDIEPIVDEIHKSNMTKDGGGLRADGKVLKGPGYVAPDIAAVIRKQGATNGVSEICTTKRDFQK
jgi:predicted HAD superfamily Cof-like phosphohydrolase